VARSLLHVTNGDSVADTLRHTTLGGAALSWQDVLHAGPLPAVGRAELLRRRAMFLSECGWGRRQAILASLERRDAELDAALARGVSVVLWFEHDLYDQLQLLDVLTCAREAGVAPTAIVVGSFPGRPSFRGLGELTADELETLWPTRRRTSSEELETAATIWAAVREPTPEPLVHWARQGTSHLPFVGAALLRLLEELPAHGDGMSGTERRALAAIADGAGTPAAAFLAAQELEPAPFLGDTWFYRALTEVGRGRARLVETEEGHPLPDPPSSSDGRAFARMPLRLTPDGERVLRGEADRVELLGVDRWVGGTHVTAAAVWRWDADAQRLVVP
jgi:hypothetical protein